MGLPNGNDVNPVPAQLGAGGCFIPKGAKNVEAAKEFVKYVIQPKVVDTLFQRRSRLLAAGLSLTRQKRPVLARPEVPASAVYVREVLMGPKIAYYYAFNPGIAVANGEQIWGMAEADIIRNGTTPKGVADKELYRTVALGGSSRLPSGQPL